MCRKYGATGPVLRGGRAYDVRKAEPYSVYPDLSSTSRPSRKATAWPATWCAWMEIEQSLRILEQALDEAAGRAVHRSQGAQVIKPPPGDYCFATEAARGRFMVRMVSNGTNTPYRVKLRTPSFANLSVFEEASQGMMLADALAVLGSLDLVIPDIDR
jgi:NADH-quinone oxidoreductase subunit D